MKSPVDIPLVTTIRERCRVCYTCVRECPAKAIRIADGQAEVMARRCIGCGNCVQVCSQRAKQVYDSTETVRSLLTNPSRLAACIAPSFPAAFPECHYRQVVGMIRALGFTWVMEVAFGADMVSQAYRKQMAGPDGKRLIATTCPAVVAYVERYHPDLLDALSPIVSPMVALARAVRKTHGPDTKIVFVGPCIAKKGEMRGALASEGVEAVLTFVELRRMLDTRHIEPGAVSPSDFDPPHPGKGALFAISRGLLQSAGIAEDLVSGDVMVADGKTDFVKAIEEFEAGRLDARLLEALACNGCIMGPGIINDMPLFARRSRISQYVRERMETFDKDLWRKEMARVTDLDLRRDYHADDQRIPSPSGEQIVRILAEMGKQRPGDELNCGACGYDTCREHAVAIYEGLAEDKMCLPFMIDQLRSAVAELNESNAQLAQTQDALMQSEKLANMGTLAAGIAHELNNPLGVVLMYAHLLRDEYGRDPKLDEDLTMITEQADRCKKIVAGLLHFARQNKTVMEPTDLRELVDRALKTALIPDNVTVEVNHEIDDPIAEMDSDQMMQVLINLVSNACAAMPEGGTLRVLTNGDAKQVTLSVSDTGMGIPKENIRKLFEPFFTTKEIGKGTGLGLAVTYGIVKIHRGDIHVESNSDAALGPTGATFTVSLPRQG